MRPETLKPLVQLKQAATRLRAADEPELADAVEYVTTREGNTAVMRAIMQQLEIDGEIQPTLAVTMPEPVREEIKATAKAKGESLTAQANEALAAFLAGTYFPATRPRAAYGTAERRVNLNLRPNRELRIQADARGKEMESELGWAPRASNVIISWLWEKFCTIPL
ncbi:hypothetical protein [Streptomyces decoyicus]